MAELFQDIWEEIHKRLVNPPRSYYSAAGSLDIKRVLFESLIESKRAIARTYDLPADGLNYFHSDREAGISEYMLDFCWTTYPRFRQFRDLRTLVKCPDLEIVLAAESEVGVYADLNRTLQLVLEDFVKLLDIQSRAKLMVYRVPWNNIRTGYEQLNVWFTQMLLKHKRFSRDDSWLFIGIPWTKDTWPGIDEVNARVEILGSDQHGRLSLVPPSWFKAKSA